VLKVSILQKTLSKNEAANKMKYEKTDWARQVLWVSSFR